MNVYIETYGCQMNKLDSESVAGILAGAGHTVVGELRAADVILLNTCGVRDNAEQRIHGRIGELSALRRERPDLLFGVIGCMAQRLGESLLSGTVRLVAGPDTYRNLPDLLEQARTSGAVDIRFCSGEIYDGIEPVRDDGVSAWVAVMRGCDNFCSYCIVPYTRGRERSIPAPLVAREVKELAKEGFVEVTLLGQNVNSYCDGDVDFARLLDMVADTGIPWVRFLTSHPKDLTTDILDVMAARPNVCRQLHLPLQSGSDKILAAMNRRYSVNDYLRLIDQARTWVPGINLSTDVMYGFPGETDDDYRCTLGVLERVGFDFAFQYRYSEREGTAAVTMPDSVPEHVRIERLKHAIDMQNAIMFSRNREHVGSEQTVLVKGRSRDGEGWYGFTEAGIPAVVRARGAVVAPGDFVRIRVGDTTGASLVGAVI